MPPKLTVITPVLNGARFLKDPVYAENIRNQTFKDLEWILIDDGSSDETWKLLNALSLKEPRITLLKNECHLGVARSVNRALEIAQGEYVTRQDVDDLSSPDRLEKEAGILDQHPEVVLVTSAIKVSNEVVGQERIYVPPRYEKLVWRLLFKNSLEGNSQVMFRRSALDGEGYENVFVEDYELWLRLSFRGAVWVLPEVLLDHRLTPSSSSIRYPERQQQDVTKVSRQYLETVLKRPLKEHEQNIPGYLFREAHGQALFARNLFFEELSRSYFDLINKRSPDFKKEYIFEEIAGYFLHLARGAFAKFFVGKTLALIFWFGWVVRAKAARFCHFFSAKGKRATDPAMKRTPKHG